MAQKSTKTSVRKPASKETARTAWPQGFVWGTSSSSYQIEGAVNEDGRGQSIWDAQCKRIGGVAYGHTGDVACDHYHRYKDDIALMKELGVGAYRFSTAWPRIQPAGTGPVNQAGLDFYDRITDTVLEAGIEPWVCLYHWDLPLALDDRGGWINRDSAGWFADYTAIVARRLGDRVKNFATFNELSVFTLFGYAYGWHAPGLKDEQAHFKSIHHVNLAHGASIDVLRSLVPDAQLGAVHNFTPVIPEKPTPRNIRAARDLHEHWNLAFPEPQFLGYYPPGLAKALEPYVQPGDMAKICRPVDWFGLNHYGPIFCKASTEYMHGFAWGDSPQNSPNAKVGWAIYPEMFTETLLELTRRYKVPVIVAENGCGMGSGNDIPNEKGVANDSHRVDFLTQYTAAMHEAIQKGADVKGYFVWSLMDNFEWGLGYSQRYGMVHVDFDTQKRTPKESYHWFKRLIAGAPVGAYKNGRLPKELRAAYEKSREGL